jgi:hypothetical protein
LRRKKETPRHREHRKSREEWTPRVLQGKLSALEWILAGDSGHFFWGEGGLETKAGLQFSEPEKPRKP